MKKTTNFIKFMLLCFLFLFITIYISDQKGYYKYGTHERKILTDDAIQRFEEDIKNGNAIDVNNYYVEDKDYSNNVSKVGLKISNGIGGFIRSKIVSFFDSITKNIK